MPRQKITRSKTRLSEVKKPQEKFNLSAESLMQRLQKELDLNQSYVSLILGLLIVLVVGVLIFNYLKKTQNNLGPAQQTVAEQAVKDVEVGSLPGKYTVKEGDTLFNIAQIYYQDGFKYPLIVQANNLTNPNVLETDQILDIPLDIPAEVAQAETEGIGGAENQTIWGEKITADTYTVAEGDWLSKIAGRAYGDIMTFDKIAQANNIANPDVIEIGTVLNIPR